MGIAALMFETLSKEGINIQMIPTSEIKISAVIDDKYMEFGRVRCIARLKRARNDRINGVATKLTKSFYGDVNREAEGAPRWREYAVRAASRVRTSVSANMQEKRPSWPSSFAPSVCFAAAAHKSGVASPGTST